MPHLKPLKLHGMISMSPEWTDELWDEALTSLLERAGTMQAIVMVEVLPNSDAFRAYPHKVDLLREFHRYPPTVLLEVFDLVRTLQRN